MDGPPGGSSVLAAITFLAMSASFFSFEMNGASNFGLWDTCTVGGGFFSERKKETGAGLGLGS
ncbi:hypothetical protein OUZ56_000091 [Daphnia magna]|uniref:Uncharacterized protein n=1 Tax=Daphnia magna TaxID=35525 RepID=A0ABQ9ZYP3_9CRUS|nr:hypothetical protein OUZ56_000091 [Daphnia magna]